MNAPELMGGERPPNLEVSNKGVEESIAGIAQCLNKAQVALRVLERLKNAQRPKRYENRTEGYESLLQAKINSYQASYDIAQAAAESALRVLRNTFPNVPEEYWLNRIRQASLAEQREK